MEGSVDNLPKMTLDQLLALTSRLSEILIELEKIKVSHLDVKPSNILYDKSGKFYISDFGNSINFENNLEIQRM